MNRSHPHHPPVVAGKDNPDNAPAGQRQQALELVAQVQQATGRRYGSATTAARILGLDPATVQQWVRDARPPPPPAVHPLAGLLHCPTCSQPMRPANTTGGMRAYQCTNRRHPAVEADHIEATIGTALLQQTPNAVRRRIRTATPKQAATLAPLLLHRITLDPTGQPLLTWHPHGHPTRNPTTRKDRR